MSAMQEEAVLSIHPAMLRDLKALLEARGCHEGNTSRPGGIVVERAFAGQ